jgi:hypothetical protein
MRRVNQIGLAVANANQPGSATKSKRPQAFKEPQTPASSKFIATGKENITPSTTNSRKSKEAASARLHDLATDIQLYEKERKRRGGVVYGGRRKSDEDRVVIGRKRSVDEASERGTSEETEVKKPKLGNPPPTMRLVVSGYKKWVGHARVEDNDKVSVP